MASISSWPMMRMGVLLPLAMAARAFPSTTMKTTTNQIFTSNGGILLRFHTRDESSKSGTIQRYVSQFSVNVDYVTAQQVQLAIIINTAI